MTSSSANIALNNKSKNDYETTDNNHLCMKVKLQIISCKEKLCHREFKYTYQTIDYLNQQFRLSKPIRWTGSEVFDGAKKCKRLFQAKFFLYERNKNLKTI